MQGSGNWKSECPASASLVNDPQTADLDPKNMVSIQMCAICDRVYYIRRLCRLSVFCVRICDNMLTVFLKPNYHFLLFFRCHHRIRCHLLVSHFPCLKTESLRQFLKQELKTNAGFIHLHRYDEFT